LGKQVLVIDIGDISPSWLFNPWAKSCQKHL